MSLCRRTLERLAPYVDGALPDGDRVDVQRHLDACPPCRRAADSVVGARHVLREAGPRLAPALPPGLRSRCEAAVPDTPGERAPFWRGRLAAFAAVALLIVATAGVLLELATERSDVVLAQQLIVDHVKCFMLLASPGAAVEPPARPFGRDLHLPPTSAAAGVTFLGVRRCLYGSGVTPHAMYRSGRSNVSLFVLDGVTRTRSDVETLGHHARIWSEGGRSYVLVSGEDTELNDAARYLMARVH
jgi:anti-sigma factor RsiW